MSKVKPSPQRRNADTKRRYFHQLREARGLSEATVDRTASSIGKYEDFFQNEDFARFNESRAIEFRKHLGKNRNAKDKPLSLNSVYQVLRTVESFFRWLMTQPGYKSKISADDIEFLQLDKKSVRAVLTSRTVRPIPTLEYAVDLVESINCEGELGKRDKALISFTLLSGMRAGAIVSLPLGAFNEADSTINQSPSLGVLTKFSKANYSRLMVFDESLLKSLLDWISYLKKLKHFSFNDPLFPAPKQEFASGTVCFISENVVNRFWSDAGPMRRIFKARAKKAGLEYFNPHSFRHLSALLALKACKTPEDIRAVSQNFGHEHILTTLLNYGQLDDRTTISIIEKLEFTSSDDQDEYDAETVEKACDLLKRLSSKKT